METGCLASAWTKSEALWARSTSFSVWSSTCEKERYGVRGEGEGNQRAAVLEIAGRRHGLADEGAEALDAVVLTTAVVQRLLLAARCVQHRAVKREELRGGRWLLPEDLRVRGERGGNARLQLEEERVEELRAPQRRRLLRLLPQVRDALLHQPTPHAVTHDSLRHYPHEL